MTDIRGTLEAQADAIEDVLRRDESPARVTGGIVTPRWVQFHLTPALGTRADRVRALADEIALALNASQVRVSRQGAAVAVEVRRDDVQPVMLADLMQRLPALPMGTAVLGIADDGAPLLLRLPAVDVGHVAIVGAGDVSLARTMIASLVVYHRPRNLVLVMRGAFGELAQLRHVQRIEPRELIRVTDSRIAGRVSRPLIVVAFDDVTDADRHVLIALTRHGHRAGVHIIACGCDATLTDGARFGVRLVGAGEPGYFAAESGAGVTCFTAACVRGEQWTSTLIQRSASKSGEPILSIGRGE